MVREYGENRVNQRFMEKKVENIRVHVYESLEFV